MPNLGPWSVSLDKIDPMSADGSRGVIRYGRGGDGHCRQGRV